MKKYITIAALAAAGAVCANAEVVSVDTSSWSDVEFTLVGNNPAAVGSDFLTGGRAGFSSLELDGENLTDISAEDYSWSISFNMSNASTGTDKMLFSTKGGGNGSGYCIGLDSSAGEVYTFALRTGGSTFADKADVVSLNGAYNSTLTLTWDAVASNLYFSVGGSVAKVENVNVADLDILSANNIGGDNPTGTIFWTNGGAEKIANISMKVSPVPEPSTFGLLAGLGALALVGTRRRRK